MTYNFLNKIPAIAVGFIRRHLIKNDLRNVLLSLEAWRQFNHLLFGDVSPFPVNWINESQQPTNIASIR